MKKSISILALLAIVATGAFAQGFSMAAGGGLLFDWSITGNGYKGTIDAQGLLGRPGSYEGIVQNLSFGGFGFFDATYAELDVSFAYGMLKGKTKGEYYGFTLGGVIGDATELQLAFTLLGKYPIGLGGFTLFPLLGADYNMVLSMWDKNASYKKTMDNNQFGLLGGVGFDILFSSALFLRAEAMFHLRFPSKLWRDMAATTSAGGYHDFKATYGMGPNIKIGLGYKFGGGGGSYIVNADTLNVRKGPSADTALVGTLSRNTRVEVLSKSGTWWKIKSGKIEGYVNSSYLKAK